MAPTDLPKTEATEQVPTPDDGMVDIHEATVDDLDAALKAASEQEVANQGDSAEESPISSEASKSEPVGPKAGEIEAQAKPDPAGAGTSQPVTQQGDGQGLQATNERLVKQNEQKELFIQRRNTELGQLRQQHSQVKAQLAAARAQLANGLEDRYQENPMQAANDRDRIKDLDNQIANIEVQEERAQRIVEAQTFFVRHIDIDNVSLDDVAEVLKSDGVPENYVQQFKANPWEFTTPEALVQMGKRAADRKGFVEADNDRRVLAKYVLKLSDEIKALRGRPAQVMNTVQRHLNQAPPVTSQSTAPVKSGRAIDPTSGMVERMSEAELNSALQNAMRQ